MLDEVWRGLHGVEALSGPRGGPLSRTVKLVLDPLVIRPALHPECAGPVVTEDGAALVTAPLHAAADRLRDTAAWFVLVKRVRREERITEGHPQDLYFPRCFELATTRGAPDPGPARPPPGVRWPRCTPRPPAGPPRRCAHTCSTRATRSGWRRDWRPPGGPGSAAVGWPPRRRSGRERGDLAQTCPPTGMVPAGTNPTGAGSNVVAARRNSLGLTPRTRLKAALNPNASE
ncbi:hypothetical protein G443_000532 [Actinoalloteichus cyanogriseus DSM 43889]|uniref:Uncharacterized protein n=1 Tax=Actinoalloteichus caeruleus DSM 43889 TaxID=1120930 RepID=A0ABT1JCP7_ACTCY|nr:hypothetical protein [Actinoalloteichus caeruleus DSM 43889]